MTVGHKLYINVLSVYGLDSVSGLLTEELDRALLRHLSLGKGTREGHHAVTPTARMQRKYIS